MNATVDHSKDGSADPVHEATETLQHIADEVERERAERGRSDIDQIHLSDGEELSTQLGAAHPDSNEDGAADRENAPRAGRTSEGAIPIQNGMKNPH